MKKIIILCSIAFLLVGCQSKLDIGDKSNIEIIPNNVKLSIKEKTLKNTRATLILKNDSNKLLCYDEHYEIEIKKNNEWHKINTQINFNEPLWGVEGEKSVELELKWYYGYGKLGKGEYRIIKEVYFEEEKDQKFYISAEFTIE